jgi:broad specificity phosphatase PhoE
LIRHGRTELNLRNVYAGWSDVGLDAVGHEQAAALARRLEPVPLAAVVASPLRRAGETAEALAAGRRIEIERRDELAELHMPLWQGLGEAEIAQRFPVEWSVWCRDPASLDVPHLESLSSAARRSRHLVAELGRRHAGRCVAVVTHEAIVRAALLTSLGIELRHYRRFRIPLASLSVLAWRPEAAQLWLMGDASHLDGGGLSFLPSGD